MEAIRREAKRDEKGGYSLTPLPRLFKAVLYARMRIAKAPESRESDWADMGSIILVNVLI